ncbi:MAG: flippase [Anaerolineae bacterium]|jgi:O-antigen/teichoic acid export membrane protein|nr:flippase [Anaerolineae bacterium]
MLLRLSKNAISLVTVGLVDKLAGVLFFAIIARKLTQEELGAYSLTLTLLLLGGLLANFGLEYVIIREVAKNRDRASALFSNSLLVTLIFSVVVWPLTVGLALLLDYPAEVLFLLGISGATLIFMSLGQTAGGVLKAYERMEIYALVGSVKSVLGLAMGVLILWMGAGVLGLLLVLMATEVPRTVLLVLLIHRRFTPLTWKPDRSIIWRIVKQALPFALLSIHGILIRRADLLLMGWLRPLEEVAVYSVAAKVSDFLDLFSGSLVGALYPAFSAKSIGLRLDSWRLYTDSLGVFAVLGFGAVFAIMALAEPILLLLSGASYLVGATALRWLGLSFLFAVLAGPVGTALMAAEDQMYRLLVLSALILGTNIALNLWLIPLYSYNGAAVAMFFSNGLGLAGRLFLARSYYGRWPNLLNIIWRPLLAGLGMVVLLELLRNLDAMVLMVVGGLTYFLLLVALGELGEPRYKSVRRRLLSIQTRIINSRPH